MCNSSMSRCVQTLRTLDKLHAGTSTCLPGFPQIRLPMRAFIFSHRLIPSQAPARKDRPAVRTSAPAFCSASGPSARHGIRVQAEDARYGIGRFEWADFKSGCGNLDPAEAVGCWQGQMFNGGLDYCAAPTGRLCLQRCFLHLLRIWLFVLRRRSQRTIRPGRG